MDGGFTIPEQPTRPPPSSAGAWISRHVSSGSVYPQRLSALDQDHRFEGANLAGARQPWLRAALAELRECPEEAREEGYPEPTEKALAIAKAILKRIARLTVELPEPSVYPTAEHEVAIFFSRNDARAGVLITVDDDAGGACFSNAGGHRRARYSDVLELANAFAQTELERLSRLSRAA